MAPKNPEYVRLVDRLARGCRVDVGASGWSIAGLDVQPFPPDDRPAAQAFVKQELMRGNLESCSKAEYDEVMEADVDFLAAAGVQVKPPEVQGHYQEAHVVGAAEDRRREIEAKRGINVEGLSYKDDQLRRKRLIAQSKGEDPSKVTLDDEEAVEVESEDDQHKEAGQHEQQASVEHEEKSQVRGRARAGK